MRGRWYKSFTNEHYGFGKFHFLRNIKTTEFCNQEQYKSMNPFDQEFDKHINKLSSELQLTKTEPKQQHCLMVLFTPFHTYPTEMSVPCIELTMPSLLICSRIINKTTNDPSPFQVVRPTDKTLLSNPYKCESTWFPFANTCLKLSDVNFASSNPNYAILGSYCIPNEIRDYFYRSKIFLGKINDRENVDQYYRKHYRSYPNIENIRDVQLAFSKLPRNSYLQIENVVNATFPLMLKRTYSFIKYNGLYQTFAYEHPFNIQQFLQLCDKPPEANNVNISCKGNQFSCSDGTCISDRYQCDGSFDCDNGEDE